MYFSFRNACCEHNRVSTLLLFVFQSKEIGLQMHEELLKVTNELYTVSNELILPMSSLCSEGSVDNVICKNKMSVQRFGDLRRLSLPPAIPRCSPFIPLAFVRNISLFTGFDGSRGGFPSGPTVKGFCGRIRQRIMPSNGFT